MQSEVKLSFYNNKFVTYFHKLPNIQPDLIYLDGPSQFATSESIDGFSINDICRMPMAADILRFEFFLEPGCLILVDGRTQNARFLKTHLKRNWKHLHNYIGDYHIFELQEKPLGKLNKEKLKFCLNDRWLIK